MGRDERENDEAPPAARDRPADVDEGDPAAEPATVEGDAATGGPQVTDTGKREVIVPMRLYKTITVFSTIIAVVAILGGFILLDMATDRAQAAASDVSIAVALLGVALILGGAATYAFSTRFRTEGMGNAKDAADEPTDNG